MAKTRDQFEDEFVELMRQYVAAGVVEDFLIIYTQSPMGMGSISNRTERADLVRLATGYAAAVYGRTDTNRKAFVVDVTDPEESN